jgi:hypothetical protein
MVTSLFSKGCVVKILVTGKLATVLYIVEEMKDLEPLAYLIETEDINLHHFLHLNEIELAETLQ